MQNYIRLNVVSIAEVLPHITRTEDAPRGKDAPRRVLVAGEMVKVAGLRLRTFSNSLTCSACGLTATHFALEKNREEDPYHLNLYGLKDGEEVLFTHDHTLARGLGGKNKIENTTTMCSPCNGAKAKVETRLYNERRKAKQNE